MTKKMLGAEDVALWQAVTATVKALPRKAAPLKTTAQKENIPKKTSVAKPEKTKLDLSGFVVGKLAHKKKQTIAATENQPTRLERRKASKACFRGRAKIDLHGHSLAEAHQALRTALVEAHAAGARKMLVITGKGKMGGGLLRREVPLWLAAHGLVRAVAPAHAAHGGDGALYVWLKK